jgi:hypothetical protein
MLSSPSVSRLQTHSLNKSDTTLLNPLQHEGVLNSDQSPEFDVFERATVEAHHGFAQTQQQHPPAGGAPLTLSLDNNNTSREQLIGTNSKMSYPPPHPGLEHHEDSSYTAAPTPGGGISGLPYDPERQGSASSSAKLRKASWAKLKDAEKGYTELGNSRGHNPSQSTLMRLPDGDIPKNKVRPFKV